MIDIEEMLDDCDEASSVPQENGGPGYSEWELEFLDSVREQFNGTGRLSDKQREKLTELWNKI